MLQRCISCPAGLRLPSLSLRLTVRHTMPDLQSTLHCTTPAVAFNIPQGQGRQSVKSEQGLTLKPCKVAGLDT